MNHLRNIGEPGLLNPSRSVKVCQSDLILCGGNFSGILLRSTTGCRYIADFPGRPGECCEKLNGPPRLAKVSGNIGNIGNILRLVGPRMGHRKASNRKQETFYPCNPLQINTVTCCQLQPFLCNRQYTPKRAAVGFHRPSGSRKSFAGLLWDAIEDYVTG